ncbi:MAG: hypothetical protein ACR2JU_02275 [Nocardioidaceae bacterium]
MPTKRTLRRGLATVATLTVPLTVFAISTSTASSVPAASDQIIPGQTDGTLPRDKIVLESV